MERKEILFNALGKSLHLGIEIAAAVLTILALFGGGGYLLDRRLGTAPWLLLAGIFISFPISLLALHRLAKKYTRTPR